MAISPITNIVGYDYQLKNLFDLVIEDHDPDPEKPNKFGWFYTNGFKFMVVDTDLDFQRFEYHNFQGKHFSKGRTFDNQTFSFTIHENTYFETMLYFEDWISKIYDIKNRVFNSFKNELEYTNVCERTFRLTLNKMPNNTDLKGVYMNTMEIILYNVKLIDRGQGLGLSYKEGDPLTYKINCVYDEYTLVPNYRRN